MNLTKVRNAELVVLKKASSDTSIQWYIPDIQNIRNVWTVGIEFYSAEIVPKDINGNDMLVYTDIQKGILNLYINAGLYVQIPLVTLIQTQSNTATSNGFFATLPKEFDSIEVDWPKSFVSTNAAVSSATKSWMFNIYYRRKNEK